MRERWYDKSTEEVLKMLQTDAEKGLDVKEASARLKADGKNTIENSARPSRLAYVRRVLSDLTAVLMLLVGLLALLYRRDMGMAALIVILAVNYVLSVVSYLRAGNLTEELSRRARPTAKVLRNGKLTVIPAEKVVMGDIIYLSHGDVVPSDARLLSSDRLTVLESELFALDGVSEKDAAFVRAGIIAEKEIKNMVYASTVVTGGTATAVAVETGEDTLVYRMGRKKAKRQRPDVLLTAQKVSSFMGIALLLPVFLTTVIELLAGGKIIEALLTGLTFAVAAMSEFYVAFVTICAAIGLRSAPDGGQKKVSAFIKDKKSLQSLMRLDCLLLPIDSFRVPSEERLTQIYDGKKEYTVAEARKNDSALRILRYGVISTGIYGGMRLAEKNKTGENIYTPEEEALIEAGEKTGIYNKKLEDLYPILEHRSEGEEGSLFETTLVHAMGEDVVVLRGDARAVLEKCTYYTSGGKILEMDNFMRREFMEQALSMIKNNRTPLAVATKTSHYNTLLRIVDCQSDLVFEGFLSIEKPFLPGSAQAVLRLRRAGVQVLAYSEEEKEENFYAAQALGILASPAERICASELRALGEEVYKLRVGEYRLFEGYDPSILKYSIDLLQDENKKKVGFLSDKLEGAYPMSAATVGFSIEDGTKLAGKRGKNRELRSPLWVKKAEKNEKYSCQAINRVSDVILPPPNQKGNGGIHSITEALRTARSFYRSVFLLFTYLFCTCGMRLSVLLFGSTGDVIAPVAMLFSGLVLDFIAVFVFAFDRFEYDLPPARSLYDTPMRAARKLWLPTLVGGVLFLLCFLFGKILTAVGLLEDRSFGSFCCIELVLLQFAVLFTLVRADHRPLKRLGFSGAFGLALLFNAAFFTISFAVPSAGALFGISFPGIAAFLPAFLLPLFVTVTGIVYRLHRQKGKSIRRNKTEDQ